MQARQGKHSKQQCKRYRANTVTANSKASATRQAAQQPQPLRPVPLFPSQPKHVGESEQWRGERQARGAQDYRGIPCINYNATRTARPWMPVLLCLRHVRHHQNGAVPVGRCALRKRAAPEGGARGQRERAARVDGASGRRERAAREGGAK